MNQYNTPPTLLCDMYKLSHRVAYPKGTTKVYSTFTPRSNKYMPNADEVVVFGIQGFIKKYLVDYFNENFFNRPILEVVDEYVDFRSYVLGEKEVDTTHIIALHDLGYLPLEIKALDEGTLAPLQVPVITVENTHAEFFWLTNFIETLMSTEIWLPMTSATQAYTMRKMLDEYAMKTVGHTNDVAWQGHDFSMRGMSSIESAMLSGAGHLLSFTGTDTIPAIYYLCKYYGADFKKELVGGSIPATEHSVMTALTPTDSNRDEYEAYKTLITETFPDGLVSLVSDSYDFWQVITETLPQLKDEIMARDGKVVIRPDSGNPVDILCGVRKDVPECERKGLIECLWETFGGTVSEQGYKVLDSHIGAIYGDSITYERAKEICERLEEKGFASTNVVFGIGSYTYQMVSRDSLGFAMKATYAEINGKPVMLMKEPKTDLGKKSQRGKVVVKRRIDGELVAIDGYGNTPQDDEALEYSYLDTVFIDGKLVKEQTLSEIRSKMNKK